MTGGTVSKDAGAKDLNLSVNITSAVEGMEPTGKKLFETPSVTWAAG